MKTEWDYSELADAYLLRPDYSEDAIETMLKHCQIKANDAVCDVGAGVAHLTIPLAKRKLRVTAVEPNDAMRKNGITRTAQLSNVEWFEGTGENTGQASAKYKLVTFGSSFNVTDRQQTLKETHRILVPNGWFACMWNHRDLEDPLQSAIETIIKDRIPDYAYGTRREDQTAIIEASRLFTDVKVLEGRARHIQTIDQCVEAWRSHATLQRQAGEAFSSIVQSIEEMFRTKKLKQIEIPYTTRIWVAKKIN